MTQHVRMHLKRKACSLPCPLDHPIETIRREWSTALAYDSDRDRDRCHRSALSEHLLMFPACIAGYRLSPSRWHGLGCPLRIIAAALFLRCPTKACTARVPVPARELMHRFCRVDLNPELRW